MSFRFAVIGDTHFCLAAGRDTRIADSFAVEPDYRRYAGMAENLERLGAMIAAERCELLISTGDLIEGGGDDAGEERVALEVLGKAAPSFFRALGTHDGGLARAGRAYCAFDRGGCRFILLDYTRWDAEQREFLREALASAAGAERIFVFGHPPLFLWGRHFFDSPRFREEVGSLLHRYRADFYFCGHTHNQAVSRHGELIQVAGSAVGYADGETVPLERYHALSPQDAEHCFYWGIAEDSAPGFVVVEVEEERTVLRWRSFHNSAWLELPARRAKPSVIEPPVFSEPGEFRREDLNQVRCGWLNTFSANKGENGSLLTLNGVELGPIPPNLCYAGRRYVMLPERALYTLDVENVLEIRFPRSPVFAAGSFSLELPLLDGRILRSAPSPELFVCGECPDFRFAAERARRVSPGERVTLRLQFPSMR